MKPTTGDQHPESKYHQLRVTSEDLQQKLNFTTAKDARTRCCNSASRLGKTLAKHVFVLLTFHLLNILVAVGGIATAVVFLTAAVMNSCWIVFYVSAILLWNPFELPILSKLPKRWVRRSQGCAFFLVCLLIGALLYASCLNAYTVHALWVFGVAGGVGRVVLPRSFKVVKILAKVDVRLIKFVSIAVPTSSATEDLQPERCAERIDMEIDYSEPSTKMKMFPFLKMTQRGWMAIFYFGVLKFLTGLLSAIAITMAVLHLVFAIYTGDVFPLLTISVTFHEKPVLYASGIALSWIVGCAGLVLGAKLSVQLVLRVFGEGKSYDEQGSA